MATANPVDGWTDFSHGSAQWSFDNDQLAEWDEDDQAFHFDSYHGLSEPTIDKMIQYIEQK